jgi:predicted DCC family thiol-disulfide oxidoreductase YuxK
MSALKVQSVDSKDDAADLQPAWSIKLLYDGLCPLCVREVNFLTRRDSGRGIVTFVDIADLDYCAADHGGVEFAQAMGRIHAVLPDGSVIRGVEVFRHVYDVLGIGWIYAATKWPMIRPVVDKLYDLWASWRLALTGRPNLATLIAERQMLLDNSKRERCRLVRH